jgi:hypothetical protein
MIFKTDEEAINAYLKYFQFNKWFLVLSIYLYCVVIFVAAYHKLGLKGLAFMLIGFAVLFYRNFIRPLLTNTNLFNHLVNRIEFGDDEISISTIGVKFYWGLTKRAPMSLTMKREEMRVKLANEYYGKAEYTGKIYLLMYKDHEFLLAENFFEDFESLKAQMRYLPGAENVNFA